MLTDAILGSTAKGQKSVWVFQRTVEAIRIELPGAVEVLRVGHWHPKADHKDFSWLKFKTIYRERLHSLSWYAHSAWSDQTVCLIYEVG